MVETILAGTLGAAVLAIVLLHREQLRHGRLITELRAEIAAQKLARIHAQHDNDEDGDDEDGDSPPTPDRRKRHLGLIKGGALGATVAALGAQLRASWQTHRPATIAATTAVGTAAVASILYLGPGDTDERAQRPSSPPTTTAAPPSTPAPTPSATSSRPATSRPPASPSSSPTRIPETVPSMTTVNEGTPASSTPQPMAGGDTGDAGGATLESGGEYPGGSGTGGTTTGGQEDPTEPPRRPGLCLDIPPLPALSLCLL